MAIVTFSVTCTLPVMLTSFIDFSYIGRAVLVPRLQVPSSLRLGTDQLQLSCRPSESSFINRIQIERKPASGSKYSFLVYIDPGSEPVVRDGNPIFNNKQDIEIKDPHQSKQLFSTHVYTLIDTLGRSDVKRTSKYLVKAQRC